MDESRSTAAVVITWRWQRLWSRSTQSTAIRPDGSSSTRHRRAVQSWPTTDSDIPPVDRRSTHGLRAAGSGQKLSGWRFASYVVDAVKRTLRARRRRHCDPSRFGFEVGSLACHSERGAKDRLPPRPNRSKEAFPRTPISTAITASMSGPPSCRIVNQPSESEGPRTPNRVTSGRYKQ